MKFFTSACVVSILLLGCDQSRFDNRLDPVGSSYRPINIQVKAMPVDARYSRAYPFPGQFVLPGSGAKNEAIVTFEAGGGSASKFRFWKGPGIDGDTSPVLDVKIQEGAVYEAWFEPLYLEGESRIDFENGSILNCGDSWCNTLSVFLHLHTRQAYPLRPWRTRRSSNASRIEPLDSSGGFMRSLLDTVSVQAGSKLIRTRLRANGGYACIGTELGLADLGLDLREVEYLLPTIQGNGNVTIVLSMKSGSNRYSAKLRFDPSQKQNFSNPVDSLIVYSEDGNVVPEKWSNIANHVTSFDICAEGSDTADIAIGGADFLGASLDNIIPKN